MKVTAILHVKDEVELIHRCIAHLYAIGVDTVIACDYRSTDGTLEILESLRSDQLSIVEIDHSVSIPATAWGVSEAELARSTRADRVLFLDADEFWLPATGSIKDCEGIEAAGVLTVDRFNIPLVAEGPCFPKELSPSHYEELLLYVRRIEHFSDVLSTDPTMAWSRGVPVPKIIAEPLRLGAIHAGHHGAVGLDGRPLPLVRSPDLVIAHLPFTTLQRFQRKVANVRQVLNTQPEYHTEGRGWHWRRWVEIDKQGGVAEEFDRQILSKSKLLELRQEGTIRSASEMLSTVARQ